jgi:hypothetical protein
MRTLDQRERMLRCEILSGRHRSCAISYGSAARPEISPNAPRQCTPRLGCARSLRRTRPPWERRFLACVQICAEVRSSRRSSSVKPTSGKAVEQHQDHSTPKTGGRARGGRSCFNRRSHHGTGPSRMSSFRRLQRGTRNWAAEKPPSACRIRAEFRLSRPEFW